MKVIPWDGQPISKPGIYSGVPMSVYHSGSLCVGPSISSSGLRTIFDPTRGPMAYWVESPLNPKRIEPADKEAWTIGRAAHHLYLGEAHFSKYFTARPAKLNDKDWNGNRTDCREWLAAVAAEGKVALTAGQIETIRGMAGVLPWQEGLEDSGLANTAIVKAGALRGLVEHTVVAIDPETGVFLLSRPDVIPVDSTEANDFKTTQAVDDRSLQRTLEDFRYDMQAELAARCLLAAADVELTSFAFIFAMKPIPHATRVVELNQADMVEAAADNRAAIRTFARCLETGRWPGPGGRVSDAIALSRSDWALKNAVGRRGVLEMELAAA